MRLSPTWITTIVVVMGVVASIAAAALLIGAGVELRDRGEAGVRSATNTTTGLVAPIEAVCRCEPSGIQELLLLVSIPETDDAVDLTQVVLTFRTPSGDFHVPYGQGDGFTIVVARDSDGSLSGDTPTLTRSDLAQLVVPFEGLDRPAPPGAAVVIRQDSGPHAWQRQFEVPGTNRPGLAPVDLRI